jgi:hypothetical protein
MDLKGKVLFLDNGLISFKIFKKEVKNDVVNDVYSEWL